MKATKIVLVALGVISGCLVVWQLASGILIHYQGKESLRQTHLHSGYLAALVALVYTACSIAAILHLPQRMGPAEPPTQTDRPTERL